MPFIALRFSALHYRPHVRRQRRFPFHPRQRLRMRKSQIGGMQSNPRCPARVRRRPAVHGPIINPLAGQRRPGFAQMDADLVRPAGLQPAFDQAARTPISSRTRTCVTARWPSPRRTAPAPTVAAVPDQPRFDPPLRRPAAGDRQISPADGMSAKLLAEIASASGVRANTTRPLVSRSMR